MQELLVRAGPAVYVVLGLVVAWAFVSVVWTALAIGRIRVPAPFWWLFPALVLTAGGAGTLVHLSQLDAALQVMDASPALELAGRAEAGLPLWLAAWATAIGLLISAPFMAAANVARAGEFPKWKPAHAAPAALALVLSLAGFASGFVAVGFGLVGAFSVALAAVRLGVADDRRRMVAGRAFVGAIATMSLVALALAHFVGNRLRVLDIWATASFDARGKLLAEAEGALPFLVGGDLVVAAAVAVASLGTLAPVARAVLDGRTSGGFLFSTFVAILPAAAVAPATTPLFVYETFDEAGARQAALRRMGIDLVQTEANAPWTPGTPVTIGVYWAHVSDERTLPYKDGRVDDGDLDGGAAIPIASAIRAVRYDPVRVEVDRRADIRRVAPVLLALRQEGVRDACIVVRSATGALGCLTLNLAEPAEEPAHVLLRSIDATLIEGEAEAEALDLAKDGARLGEVARPIVVHPDHSVSAQRLVEALARIAAASEPPLLALD
ncbi:MAG: hypothetical protein H6737_01865 [Alphaproteobacteria bacterium]|nr:hypothetical protein [Alphaproteobacteria bacterium]